MDEDFKDWMKTELNSIHDEFGNVRKEMYEIRNIAEENQDTLKRYMWFWRGVRYVLACIAALVTFNWKEFLRLVGH